MTGYKLFHCTIVSLLLSAGCVTHQPQTDGKVAAVDRRDMIGYNPFPTLKINHWNSLYGIKQDTVAGKYHITTSLVNDTSEVTAIFLHDTIMVYCPKGIIRIADSENSAVREFEVRRTMMAGCLPKDYLIHHMLQSLVLVGERGDTLVFKAGFPVAYDSWSGPYMEVKITGDYIEMEERTLNYDF